MLTTAIAIVFLVIITKENTKLRLEASQYKGALAGPQTAQIGDIVPPFYSLNLEGQQVHITYDESAKYLLYIFSPACAVCISQITVWNRLTPQAISKNIKVFGLLIDPADVAKSYLKDIQYNFNVTVLPNKAIQRAYRVVSIPQVMLVSPKGVVEWVHYGEMSEDIIRDLLSKMSSIE